MEVKPRPEHVWLQKMIGEWTWEHDVCESPEHPAEKGVGREVVRPIGEVWVQGESQGRMPCGGECTNVVTLGYDDQRRKFVGTWIGSMMTNLWVYEGFLGPSGQVLTLETEGPDFNDPEKTGLYRDVMELKSDDYRVLTSYARQPDGTWNQFMTAHYRRVK